MKSTIYVFGHDDTFDPDSIRRYIEFDIFADGYDCRYRYNQLRNNATIIVLSHAGKVYGHFETARWEEPTGDDMDAWPRTKRVYIVNRSFSYEKPIELQSLHITGIQFGKSLGAQQFQAILKHPGKVTMNRPARA